MISWKHSFKRLSEEYEMAKKKKQALDNLLNTGKISPPTHELFNKEIDATVEEIEKQQRALLEKMNTKMMELEEQIKTLEMFLANFEIQHVTGEVDDETYQREINLLSVGLDTARNELGAVKEAINQLSTNTLNLTADVSVQEKIEPQSSQNIDVPQAEIKVAEETPPVVEIKEITTSEPAQEQAQPTETQSQTEEKQEA
ncbi:MAG: CdvA-like protein [Candidatus Bathyarchaeota archaeon]|nr:CdvA-like protein [Candidatus Bathyarchaeota archaeon A05DMB-5]MDH7557995.1 CdvA-like protein [Candidatus Bathyarchaeota archaeon]